MKSEFKVKRKKLLINSRLQVTILIYSFVLAGSITVLNHGAHYFVVHLNSIKSPGLVYGAMIFLMFVYFLTIVGFGLVLTNRIVGPIHRIKAHLEGLENGSSKNDLSFRKNDYFTELLGPYNKTLKRMRKANKS